VSTRSAAIARYWAAAADGELHYEWCEECGLAVFPPRASCPYCWSAAGLSERVSAGLGTVYSHAEQPSGTGADEVFLLVELDEGYFLFTKAASGWSDVTIGARVTARFVPLADGRTGPVFGPVGEPDPAGRAEDTGSRR
jgi:uncharacterized protein